MSNYKSANNQDSKRSWYKKQSIKLDMNPMVDLAFLLITFFMLTTTFNKPNVMEITVPLKPQDEEQDQQPVKESKVLTFVLSENDQLIYLSGDHRCAAQRRRI